MDKTVRASVLPLFMIAAILAICMSFHNSPNDLIFTSSTDLCRTDPPFGLLKAFDDSRRELNSFFPSSGAMNPALTIIANALWVGDHLLVRLC